jgi:uncharacterized protein YdhG (YjbR/CyaY superfamily)
VLSICVGGLVILLFAGLCAGFASQGITCSEPEEVNFRDGGWAMRGKTAKNVDEYLAGVPEPARGTLKHVRAVIRSEVPAETTEVISYGIPMFNYKGMLVGYAAFKNHCSLFPTGSGVKKFEKELQGFATSKGTIQFPSDKPLPDALVKKIVKTRVAENEEWD